MLLVTGGAGFIGSNFVQSTIAATREPLPLYGDGHGASQDAAR